MKSTKSVDTKALRLLERAEEVRIARYQGIDIEIPFWEEMKFDIHLAQLLWEIEKDSRSNPFFKHKEGCIWGDDLEHMHLVPIDCYVKKS